MKSLTGLLLLLALVSHSWAGTNVRAQTVVHKDIGVPWAIAWLPDGDMLVSVRSGTLYRIGDGDRRTEIGGLPEIHANGQGGLLDLVLHPDYKNNGWLYLSYSSPEGEGRGSNTAVMRARLADNQLTAQRQLYKATPNSSSGRHYGSRIAFDDEGLLYFSVGDRGQRDKNPQDLSRDGGKIYRLKDDGQVPADNPFVDRDHAIAAIYSLGHRNPQGMAMHPETGDIWLHEHGPRGGDEINRVKAGANYGWPILSYGINYSGTEFAEAEEREGYESPLYYWDPSIAPSGMAFVTSERYPDWQGQLLVGSLKFRHLQLCQLQDNKVRECNVVLKDLGRVRDVRQAPDGYLYIATDDNGILRLIP